MIPFSNLGRQANPSRRTRLAVFLVIASLMILLALACGEKFPLPQQQETRAGLGAVADTSYIQLSPVWGRATGYNFSGPADILVGREPLLYVADTGNDRIIMLDLAGNVLGHSQTIEGPVALAQDSRLNLIIANGTNRLYMIDLFGNNHNIATAPVDTFYHDIDHPERRFTGAAAFLVPGRERLDRMYLATAAGPERTDNAIFSFGADGELFGPLNLEPNGTGIFSVSTPSGITALRDFSQDFIFTQEGENFYKVQWIGFVGGEVGLAPRLDPARGNFDIFAIGQFEAPQDVTVDQQANIYVVDAARDSLFKFTSGGKEVHSFGGTGNGDRQFNGPRGVAFFDRTLYVADTGNDRIVRFKLSTDFER